MKKRLAKKIYYAYSPNSPSPYWLRRMRLFYFCMVGDHRIEKAIRIVNKLLKTKNNGED